MIWYAGVIELLAHSGVVDRAMRWCLPLVACGAGYARENTKKRLTNIGSCVRHQKYCTTHAYARLTVALNLSADSKTVVTPAFLKYPSLLF